METRTDPYVNDAGRLFFDAHPGQAAALSAAERFVLVLAGTQGGKTSFGPWWMLREITRRGPGDYLVVAPTFRLLELKCLPEYKRLFRDRLVLGTFRDTPTPLFTTTPRGEEVLFGAVQPERTRILFGHAQDPDSLESATAKAAHLDEPGQRKFKLGSWEAVQRRLSIHEGRALFTTTPYTLGWLKAMHDRAGVPGSPKARASSVALVQFESTMNPAFPRAEFERMRDLMPPWKFNMMYRGRFERPAGIIYDVFDRAVHVTPAFDVPASWPRYDGLDFGGVNTADVEVRQEPGTNRYVLTRAYHAGSRTAAEHAAALVRAGHPRPVRAWGGAPSEDNWRREFGAAGFPILPPPVKDVEVGIDRLYALYKNHPALVRTDGSAYDPARPYIEYMDGADGVADLIDETESYSRELDDNDEPTEKIEDKSAYHLKDAERYLAAGLVAPVADWSTIPAVLGK